MLASYRSIKQEDVNRLEHLLPDTVSNIPLVLEIEKIANNSGVFIRDVKFGTDKEDTNSLL